MKIYGSDFERLAKLSISRWGNCEEHNYWHFIDLGTQSKLPVFISFDDDAGILALRSKSGKLWYMVREVLAPKEKKAEIFLEFADNMINKEGVSRIQVEVEGDFMDELKNKADAFGLRVCPVYYTLDWPLFNMSLWDGDIMPGKDWKKLRNIKNAFYKEHKVEIKDASGCDKEELKQVVISWKKNRNAKDFAHHAEYLNLIDNGFKGFDEVRVLVVDGKPRAITGGWKIPNSSHYYSSLGVHDYSIERLGEISNLDDLSYLKSRGYGIVNFGGSDSDLLGFKKKFKPDSLYRTHFFSIMKKNG